MHEGAVCVHGRRDGDESDRVEHDELGGHGSYSDDCP